MVTTGVSWNKLLAPGAEALSGRGIYYGAAMTEALNCKDEEVYLVGAGNSAGQAAMYFAAYARRVVIIVRGKTLEAKMSQYLVDRIHTTDNIEVLLHSEVAECHGESHLESITIENRASGEKTEAPANWLFIFIGAAPKTDWLDGVVVRDRHGFIVTGPDLDPARDLKNWPLDRAPFLLEASVPGIFAAGDVRHESVKRVASAVGEGSVAVQFMHRHLAAL
jgi:thioredoxin reductase (NADPH)